MCAMTPTTKGYTESKALKGTAGHTPRLRLLQSKARVVGNQYLSVCLDDIISMLKKFGFR